MTSNSREKQTQRIIFKTNIKMKLSKYILPLAVAALPFALPAQSSQPIPVGEGLSSEVKIENEFEPSIGDASKINQLPDAQPPAALEPPKPPALKYYINSRPLPTQYQATPIKAATMKPDSLQRYYRALATLGGGNYASTLAGISFGAPRGKKLQYLAEAKHFASGGTVTLERGKEIEARRSSNSIGASGKYLDSSYVINASTAFEREVYGLYGFNTIYKEEAPKTMPKQRFLLYGFDAGLHNLSTDSAALRHNSRIGYAYGADNFAERQHSIEIGSRLEKRFGLFTAGCGLGFEMAANTAGLGDTLDQYGLLIAPRLAYQLGIWRLHAGLDAQSYWGAYPAFYLIPVAGVRGALMDGLAVPYLEIGGSGQMYSMKKAMQDNPYLRSGAILRPQASPFAAKAGIEGRISKRGMYNLCFSFESTHNQHFYVNDTVQGLRLANVFVPVYDDAQIFAVQAEIGLLNKEKSALTLSATYRKISLTDLSQPWHIPQLEASLQGFWNLGGKIIAHAEIFAVGQRWAQNPEDATQKISLNGFVDGNLGIEYRYTKFLTAFLQIGNIAAQKYQRWNYYAVQRFNLLAGVNYAL